MRWIMDGEKAARMEVETDKCGHFVSSVTMLWFGKQIQKLLFNTLWPDVSFLKQLLTNNQVRFVKLDDTV